MRDKPYSTLNNLDLDNASASKSTRDEFTSTKDASAKALQSQSVISVSELVDTKFLKPIIKKTKSKDDFQLEQNSDNFSLLESCNSLIEQSNSASLISESVVCSSNDPLFLNFPLPPPIESTLATSSFISGSQTTNFSFPPELLEEIFSYFLSFPQSLAICSQVCKYWYLLSNKMIWSRPRIFSLSSIVKLSFVLNSVKRFRETEIKSLDLTLLDEADRNYPTISFYLATLIASLGNTLVELDLGFCRGFKNYDLQRVLPFLNHLTSLNLAGGNRSDIVLTKLVKHCPQLQRLSLSWNYQLTDFGFIELSRRCRQLVCLDLTNCAQISDLAVQSIANNCSRLRVVSLSFCQCVTDVALWHLLSRCTSLEILNVLGCSGVSSQFASMATARHPKLLVNISSVLPFYHDLSRPLTNFRPS